MVRFGVLGPVTAGSEQGPVDLGPARQRTVLAVLLLEPGATVSVDQLVDRVWGESLPQRARPTLYTYLSRLRTALATVDGPTLRQRSGGYLLDLDPMAVDLHRFRHLVTTARQAGDDATAADAWRQALRLWRGRPFADLDSAWLHSVATGLETERVAAQRDATDVWLRTDEPAQLVPELTAAAAAHPLDERLAGQLMLALYRCGRQADALAHYEHLRDQLADQLGSDPGPAIRTLHRRILRQDPDPAPTPRRAPKPAGSVPSNPPPATAPPPAYPAQLPADVAGFTGRGKDLHALDLALRPPDSSSGARAMVITAIGGTAGVGKTALALHWAHRTISEFPDGQLYLNLRGYDPAQPVDPADALARFLAALGVAGPEIPVELDDRAARFRSMVAGRRMLIVLDNAATVAQVRPLLPGSRSCAVLVTSRDSLAGLVSVDGARRLSLDLLPADEAVGLLRELVGSRVDEQPAAARTLAEQCARLPLALRIAAEQAAARPQTTLAELVSELADRQTRLAQLDTGDDPYAAVREVFSWSIQRLPAEAVRLFRLLGLHPGPDLDPYAAAALAGTAPDQARSGLELLVRAHLLHPTGSGRYGMHDLLRAYAIDLVGSNETDQQRQAAELGLRDYYLAAAISAMDILHPAESHYRPARPAATTPELTGAENARTWLEAERACLVAALTHAATTDNTGYTNAMARTLHRFLVEAHPPDLLTVGSHLLRVSETAGDLSGQAFALRQLANTYNELGQYERTVELAHDGLTRSRRAGDHLTEAFTLAALSTAHYRLGEFKQAIDGDQAAVTAFRRAGDRLGEAGALMNLAIDQERLGQLTEAADHIRQALVLFRELGSRYHEGLALVNLGEFETRLGEYAAAGQHIRESLAIVQLVGGPSSVAHALDSLGVLHLKLGEPEPATDCFAQALTRYRQVGDKTGQAYALNGLGEAARLAGRAGDGLTYHTEALALATETKTRHPQGRAHAGLGHHYQDRGDLDQARTQLALAHAIYLELDVPEADEIHADLANLAGS